MPLLILPVRCSLRLHPPYFTFLSIFGNSRAFCTEHPEKSLRSEISFSEAQVSFGDKGALLGRGSKREVESLKLVAVEAVVALRFVSLCSLSLLLLKHQPEARSAERLVPRNILEIVGPAIFYQVPGPDFSFASAKAKCFFRSLALHPLTPDFCP